MIPAGRQCSFWSSDGVLGNRPVPPPALPISPDNAVYKAELRQLFQECQVAGSRVGHPPEVPVTDEASFRQDSTLYATW